MIGISFLFLLLPQTISGGTIPIKARLELNQEEVISGAYYSVGFPVPSSRSHGFVALKAKVLSALASPIRSIYTKLRPAAKIVGFMYLGYQVVNYFLPTITGAWDSNRTSNQRELSLSDAIGELGMSAISESLQSWQDGSSTSVGLLNTWEKQCKSRATCELGRSLASRMPYLSKVIGYFGSRLPFIGNFQDALMMGTALPDCSAMYPDCPYVRPTVDEL